MLSFKYFTKGSTKITAANLVDDQEITLEFPEPNIPIYHGPGHRENAVFAQYDPLHVELKLHCTQSDKFYVYSHPRAGSTSRPYFNVYLCRENRENIPECTSIGLREPTVDGDTLKLNFEPYLPNVFAHKVNKYCLCISMECVIPPTLSL